MKRKQPPPSEGRAKLREVGTDLNKNKGAPVEAACLKMEISEQTFHR
jgi:hypothetical protein